MRLTHFMPGAAWQLVCLLLISTLIAPSVSAAPEDEVAYVYRTEFEHPPTQIEYFEDSTVVLMLVREAGILRISKNGGEKWDFAEEPNEDKNIVGLFMNPNDKDSAVAIGSNNRHFATFDRAETWVSFKTENELNVLRPNPISFHADDPKKIIMNTFDPSEDLSDPAIFEAFYTTDGFKTGPSLLKKGAAQCIWAKEKPQFTTGDKDKDASRTLCTVPGPHSPRDEDYRLLISDDYFKDGKGKEPNLEGNQPVPGIISLVTATKYVMAARKAESTSEMGLYTTNDTINWHRALFSQQKVNFDGYTVLESTNHSIRIDVLLAPPSPFVDNSFGTLFQSNSEGTQFTRGNGDIYTNRNTFGFVDFEQLANVEGVVLINAVENAEQVSYRGDDKRKVSRISFDDGRTFQPLTVTVGEGKGGDLHLHSVTDLQNTGRVFSSPAPGILLGVGNVGKELGAYDKGDTYISNDGGLTWGLALFGPHKFEFGDQGSIKVAVYDKGSVNKVSYAFKDAIDGDWRDLHIKVPTVGEDGKKLEDGGKFSPRILTTMPDSTGQRFILQATEGRGQEMKDVVYAIDFSKADKRKCGTDDFEEWSARDGKCIMGHKQVFRRRKPNADCFVKDRFNEPLPDESENCPCEEADYECDYHFVRDKKDKTKCVPSADWKVPEGECKGGAETFKGPSGYRLIPGNTCVHKEGKNLDEPKEWSCGEKSGKPSPSNGTILVEPTEFKSKGTDAFAEYWYLERAQNDEKEVILMTLRGSNELFTTQDHGKTWVPRSDKVGDQEIVRIIPNKHERNHAYFITPSKDIYFTEDQADTIEKIQAPSLPRLAMGGPLRFHEKHPNWLIWIGCRDDSQSGRCATQAWVSKKRGQKWEPMLTNVENCEFLYREERGGSEEDENLVYCAAYKSEKGRGDLSLVSSKDFFERETLEYKDMLNFATMSEFIVVAKRDEKDGQYLEIDASVDGKHFANAQFPYGFNVEPTAYTVLDSSTHAVFVHATTNSEDGQEYGTILKSNSNGTYYVKVLDGVNRNTAGYVDFEKMLSIEGVSIVNRVSNVEEVDHGSSKKLQTFISHNDGGEWSLLSPPTNDGRTDYQCDGKPAQSQRSPGCALHLHQYTERQDFRDTLSSPSAIGMMVAQGNVGPYLLPKKEENTDTFITRDGGITWKTAMKGQYMWEFGDQGSIIVLVAEGRKTNKIYYSRDEGDTWTEKIFSEEEVDITDITTMPQDGSRNFLLWANDRGRPMTFNIDFTWMVPNLCRGADHPDTADSDYKIWIPRHPKQEDECLFGHVAKYLRKKRDSDCFNGAPIQRPLDHSSEICACKRIDFECAFNYERNEQDGNCHKIAGLPDVDPKEVCKDPNVTGYNEPSPYRRSPLDTCKGGEETKFLGESHPCPGKEDEWKEEHRGISGAGLFFAIVVPIAVAAGVGYFVYRRYAGNFGQIRLGDATSGPSFSTDSRVIAWPIAFVSAIAAGVMAIPGVVGAVARGVKERVGGRRRAGWRNAGYTSRNSFARGRGNYSAVGGAELENDLLGEESDED